VRDLPTI